MHFLNFFAKKELQQEGRFTYLIKGVTINSIAITLRFSFLEQMKTL